MSANTDCLTICPMDESDLEQVLDIEVQAFLRPWSRSLFLDELASSFSFQLVAVADNAHLVGYICAMQVLDEGHILNLAVHPQYRGLGVGKLLVQSVLTHCSSAGAAYVGLEVRSSNTAAITLYRQLGFRPTGVRKKYYENKEDALLMEYPFDTGEVVEHAVQRTDSQ